MKKYSNVIRFSLRFNVDNPLHKMVYKTMSEMDKANGRSMNQYIIEVLAVHFENKENQPERESKLCDDILEGIQKMLHDFGLSDINDQQKKAEIIKEKESETEVFDQEMMGLIGKWNM